MEECKDRREGEGKDMRTKERRGGRRHVGIWDRCKEGRIQGDEVDKWEKKGEMNKCR